MMNSGNITTNANSGTVWVNDFTTGGWGGTNPIWIDHTKTNTITTDISTGWVASQAGLSEDEIQFFELVLTALGVDIKFEDFKNMTPEKRKSLLREVKINLITK